MLIGIDPGHGGRDPGAVGPSGVKEKDVTLGISQKVAMILQASGVDTYQTRTIDETLELVTRTSLLNNMKCNYAVSIHCNSSVYQDANYVSTYIQGTGGQAEKLAQAVQAQLVAATGWPDGGIKTADLHMNRETKMPSILCECGFISNPEQKGQLADPAIQGKIALAIAQGIMDYLGIGKEAKPVGITTVDEALTVLQAKGIITSPDYWELAAQCVMYLDNLLIKVANYIK